MILDIQTPRAFQPLLAPRRYKGVHGGRGSGKSHFFGEMLVERGMLQPGMRAVCIREVQKSLEQSVKKLIEDKIEFHKLGGEFQVLDKEIRTPGGGVVIFQGMQNHTADSVKSLEGYDIAWIEEAQSLSAHSLKLLRPTIRKPGSEIWASWNPASPEDPVDALFRGPGAKERKNMVTVQANFSDNPWFPQVLEDERLDDLQYKPDDYDHIWEGGYVTISDALVFKGKFSIEDFETPSGTRFYFGADFGFAKDPSTLVRCWVKDKVLFIDAEAGGVGIELDAMSALYDSVPETRRWPIKADGARPETISFLKRQGFAISAAKKWAGSVEDGLAHLKGFRRIVIHPRCVNTAREFRVYSYKVDRKTDDILPVLVDDNNHYIDALRYSQDGLVRGRGPMMISKAALARR